MHTTVPCQCVGRSRTAKIRSYFDASRIGDESTTVDNTHEASRRMVIKR